MFAVITKEIRESWQTMLLSWTSLVGILAIASLFQGYSCQFYAGDSFADIISGGMVPFVILTLYVFSAVAACAVFKRMRNMSMRLQSLMLPASQTEKFAAAWIIAVPGFFISFVAALYASQLIAAAIFPILRTTDLSYPLINWIAYGADHFSGAEWTSTILGLLFFQSFFLLGGIVWAKSPIIKTFAMLIAIGFIYSLCSIWVEYMTLLSERRHFGGFGYISPDSIKNTALIVTSAIILFNYALAWLRLREAEIVNRW